MFSCFVLYWVGLLLSNQIIFGYFDCLVGNAAKTHNRPPPAKFSVKKKIQNFEKTPPPTRQKKNAKKVKIILAFSSDSVILHV